MINIERKERQIKKWQRRKNLLFLFFSFQFFFVFFVFVILSFVLFFSRRFDISIQWESVSDISG